MKIMSYDALKGKVTKFSNITERPMFGYDCFSANGKFFVGFSISKKT